MSTLFDCGFTPLQAQLDIGLQYYGSKNKITPFLFQNFYKIQPNAKVLFDLFGGGGSVSFAGLASNLKVFYNELKSDMPIMFSYVVDCIKSPRSEIGIFDKDLYRFCDRSQFFEIRDKYKAKVNLSPLDLIRRYIYSFNCAGLTYLKSEWKTQFAKAGHNMVISPYFSDLDYKAGIRVFLDYMCGELGNDERILEFMLLDFCENPKLRALSIWDRRKLFGKMIISVEALCIAQLLSHFKGFDCKGIANYPKVDICALIDKYAPNLPKKEYEKPRKKGLSECRALQRCQQLERLQRLEQLQQLQQLERLERLERELPNLTITNKSYADFDFMQISKEFGLKPCEMLIYCFDKETQIFTQNGWKYLKDIDLDSDLFLSRNPKNNEIDFVKGILKQNFHYKGKMYNYKGKSIDLCVTPNHRLFIAKKHTRKNIFKNHFVLAEDFHNKKNTNSYFVSAGGVWNGKHIETIDICNKSYNAKDFAFLLGIFITDGSVNKQGIITISQSKKQNVAIIKDLLDRLGIKYTYSAKNNYFYITRGLLPFFKQFYLKEQRRIPADFKSLSKDILQNLLNGIILGDGCVGTNKTEICICDNKGLINDICEIIYKCGLACRVVAIKPQKTYLKSENRYINPKKPYIKIRIHTTQYKKRVLENEFLSDYDDFVYCVTLEKWHSVLIKRNDKQIWCGQCDIPYKSTCVDGYHNSDKNTNGFDYNAFVEWAQKQVALGFNVFLSEFETPCPATFKEIASVKKGISLNKGKSDRNFVLEKLFLARGIK